MKRKKDMHIRIWRFALWALSLCLVSAIVHLVSILLMPALAPRNAYARLAGVAAPNHAHIIDASLLPDEDPASLLAVCRFDLRETPVRLSGRISADAILTLSFHTQRGTNFYGLNDRAAQNGKIDLLLATREQIEDLETDEGGEAAPELRLEAPATKGFVLLRAVAERAALQQEARDMLASFTCQPKD